MEYYFIKEVNYFAKCPNFLKKYFFNKYMQINPVVVFGYVIILFF